MSVPARQPAEPSTATRWFYVTLGFMCLATGFVGLVTPGLPGFLFFLIALWSFSKSSPRMESWMLDHPRIGPSLRDWQTSRSMSSKAKLAAITSIVLACSLSAYVFRERSLLAAAIILAGLGTSLYLLYRPTR